MFKSTDLAAESAAPHRKLHRVAGRALIGFHWVVWFAIHEDALLLGFFDVRVISHSLVLGCTFRVAVDVAHATDHHLARGQTVAGVQR